MIADVSYSTYFGMPAICFACIATFIAAVVGTVLALRTESHRTGLSLLRIALYSVPVEIGLLLLVLALET